MRNFPIMRFMLAALALLAAGCVSEYTGSSTIVGEQLVLPEVSDSSDNVSLRVYENIKGARVWTAKDSSVSIAYTNSYTNTYFGIVDTKDTMILNVTITPCESGEEDEGETKQAKE